MHPVPPKQDSGLSALFAGKLVLIGVMIGALLIFLAIVIGAFWAHGVLRVLFALGAGAGFVASFGGAFLGKEFNKDQRLGLYIVSAAFMVAMAVGIGGGGGISITI
jgi:hypothetical protein